MKIRLTQPWEIRLFHWLFFVTVILKLWSGFYISSPDPLWGFSGMYSARMLHATLTPVLAALLVFRLYFGVISGDWRQILIFRRNHLTQVRHWLRYFLFIKSEPPTLSGKYQIGQRVLFSAIFLTMPFFYVTGVILLNLPFFRFLNLYFGGHGIARMVHFLASVLLTALAAVHIYLALMPTLDRLRAMVRGSAVVRETLEERDDENEQSSRGGSGKPDYVR